MSVSTNTRDSTTNVHNPPIKVLLLCEMASTAAARMQLQTHLFRFSHRGVKWRAPPVFYLSSIPTELPGRHQGCSDTLPVQNVV